MVIESGSGSGKLAVAVDGWQCGSGGKFVCQPSRYVQCIKVQSQNSKKKKQ
jgi:hypothetical protein